MKNIKREAAVSAIIAFFKENEDVFNDCMEDLDSYNGYLGDDRYYPMEELELLIGGDHDPIGLLQRAFYGHDEETWTTNSYGEKEYGPFNPNREYFTFSGYGNLVSADYKDYSCFMDEYAVEAMSDHRNDIWTIEDTAELAELFDALDEIDVEGEEIA